MVGLANRINTPVSLALTSIGTAEQQIQKLQQAVQENKLSRSEMEKTTSIIADSIKLSHEKLILTSALLEQFNDLNTLEDNYQVTFELGTLLNELKASLVNLAKHYSIEMETDKILLTANKNAIWKVLHQLIENSIIHGFAGKTKGKVFISASQKAKQIVINYQDNGNGIPKVNKQKVFEPYFTTKAKEGSSGLGLPTISSLLETTLSGQITLVDSPVGARFEIILNQC